MKTSHLLSCLVLGIGLAVSAWADFNVGAGGSYTVTNAEALGQANVVLGNGSALVLPGTSAGVAGLNEYTRTGAGGLGTPGFTSYGTWTRITTNAAWASATITNATATEYIYTGRWYVPSAGVYSFYEHIDDAALIALDGVTVVVNGVWNESTCVRNISLTPGWHDLELRVYNGAASGGIATNALASGFLYSPSNDLISVANQTNAFPFVDTGDGASLLSVHNGVLPQKIFVSGQTTFDLSGHGMALPLSLTGGLAPETNSAASARVTVTGGGGELAFGARSQVTQFAPFNADVAFAGVASPAGVTFRDFSTVVAWPTSCAWRVADNATVALAGTNMLGAGDVALTNFNLYVLSRTAVANDATIHVQGTNLTAALKPCTVDTTGWWFGAGFTLTNDVSLEGVGSTALLPINVDSAMQGAITGTGTVSKTGTARFEIKEPCSFVGPVTLSAETGTLIIDAATAGHSNNTVTVGAGGTFALYPAGYGTTDTAAWIKSLRGGGATAKLFLPARQTMTVDVLDGALTVQGAGATLRVNALGTNAALSVVGQTAVVLGSAAPGAAVALDNSSSLSPAAAGVTLDSLNVSSGSASVSGALTIGMLGGSGRLVKQGPDALTVCFSTNSASLQVDGGKVTLSPTSDAVLGSLPALWLDASASNVFTQYKSYTYSNGWINIERWNDCRPDAPFYGFNNRGGDYVQTYPYVMTGALNGLPVVSMGAYQAPIYPPYVRPGDLGGTEARRLPLSANIAVQYAVMVFGSQNGGGATVLGSNLLIRAGATTNDFRNPATPILASASYPTWTNGVAVVATNTGFTGGYQILSINAKGSAIGALGMRVDNTTAGGQNYAEVLFYTNALTTLQRMAVEAYLAAKWGLPYTYAELPSATVAAGATLEVGAPFTVARLHGAGTISLAPGAAFALSGLFTGTVALNGAALSIPNLPTPPGAASVPTNTMTVWFDPSLTNRVVLGGKYTPSRPLTVAALFDRTTTNRYLFGSCPTDASSDRRPWLAVTNNPLGETLHWLDYTNIYSGDLNGNTLRLYRNPAYIGTSTTGFHTPTNVQTGFIVLDSSRGAGVPITLNVDANQVFTRDNSQSFTSPIWGSASSSAVKSGQTYLDGLSVNGAARGYNGTTELLSFVTTNVVQAAFFGHYGGDGSPAGTRNRERLGEIILFETALGDSSRADTEAYLMRKWFAKARAGYSDATFATLSGGGTVTAAKIQQLPALGAGFTGGVTLTDAAFAAFTFTTNALGQYAVAPSLAVPGALTVPAAGTVSVNFLVRPMPGSYTLLSYGSVSGTGFSNWTLATSGNAPAGPVRLQATGTALTLVVIPQGSLILVQ